MNEPTAERGVSAGALPALRVREVPPFPGVAAAIGAGLVWAAIGQGSSELIWWPYLTAKYGGHFLFCLIPACLLGLFVNQEVARYTALTGENILTGFARLNRFLSGFLWVGMIVAFLWFGGYASAGGTALAALTDFPRGWSARGQSLFWGYSTIAVYLLPLLLGRVVYRVIEIIMKVIAILTVLLLLIAISRPDVLGRVTSFAGALVSVKQGLPANWEHSDASILITAIALTGMGGYFTLMYSYWTRDKQVGMARYCGRVTSPITGKSETIPATGFAFDDTPTNRQRVRAWLRALWIDNGIGVGINLLTTLALSLLAFAILAPGANVPSGWNIAVTQAAFFEGAWGTIGRALFFLIAAAFLSDTWLGITDAVSRMNADFLTVHSPRARRLGFRWWYYATVAILTVATCTTMLFSQPGTLIVIGAIINFVAMAIYCPALIILNFVVMPKALPRWTRPSLVSLIGMSIASVTYILLTGWYCITVLGNSGGAK